MSTIGERDQKIAASKNYTFALSYILGLHRVPSLHRGEWHPPRLLFDRSALEAAFAVIKFVQAPGWGTFVLQNRCDIPVFHIMRHPAGFLNSWRNRYLAKHRTEDVLDANRWRLKNVLKEDPSWEERFGSVESMDVRESELWYWCYANEKLLEHGENKERYKLIVYDQMADDAVPILQDCYSHCGLEWTNTIERKVRKRNKTSFSLAYSWKVELSQDEQKLVRRILDGSRLAAYW